MYGPLKLSHLTVTHSLDSLGTFTITEETPTVIVLQQIDNRYFRDHSGWLVYHFDFVLFKKGSKEPIARPVKTEPLSRSVILEVKLEPGDYVVHARLDMDQMRQEVRYSQYKLS